MYTLTKVEINKPKKPKYRYTVTDQDGKVISTRQSDRNYIACTANGNFFFGRLELIGKGTHKYQADNTLHDEGMTIVYLNPPADTKKPAKLSPPHS